MPPFPTRWGRSLGQAPSEEKEGFVKRGAWENGGSIRVPFSKHEEQAEWDWYARDSDHGETRMESAMMEDVDKTENGEVYFETEPGTRGTEPTLSSAVESSGNEEEEEPEVPWILTSFLIIAGTVSLGVLAMASNVSVLGYVPGTLLIVGLGVMATYTGVLIWEVYMDHQDEEIEGYGQAAAIIFGPRWGVVVQLEQSVLLFFFIAATALTAGEAIYSLAQEKVCLAIMALVGALGGWLLSFPVYLKGVSLLSALSFFCIIVAIVMNIAGVSQLNTGPVDDVAFPGSGTTLRRAFGATVNIIFAYAGHLVFFEFIHIMQRPQDFGKALYVAQAFAIAAYAVVGPVLYSYLGSDAQSPALLNLASSSAYAIVGWAFLLPNVIIGGVIDANVLNHQVVKVFRWFKWFRRHVRMGSKRADEEESKHIPAVTWTFRFYWMALLLVLWMLAYVVGSSIPSFNDLLGIISALFSTQFTYGLPTLFWLVSNYKLGQLRAKWFKTILNTIILVGSIFTLVMGTYVSVRNIIDDFQTPFSCTP